MFLEHRLREPCKLPRFSKATVPKHCKIHAFGNEMNIRLTEPKCHALTPRATPNDLILFFCHVRTPSSSSCLGKNKSKEQRTKKKSKNKEQKKQRTKTRTKNKEQRMCIRTMLVVRPGATRPCSKTM